jgi:hypothetical protein
MIAAGERATPERPIGWVMMEPDRAFGQQVIRVRSWPGNGEAQVLATAHSHGAWVDADATRAAYPPPIDLPSGAKVVV